jgi:Cu(I)/Ag(I) efflux system membrane fusion protein
VDLSELWLYLDAYESDLTWLRYGQDVAFTVESFPGETFHGRIAFIEPEVTRETRTISVRVNVANSDGRLKPGMFARAIVEARMAAGGKVYAPEFAGKWISPMHPEIVKDGPGSCDVCGMALVPAEELGYVSAPDTSCTSRSRTPSVPHTRDGKSFLGLAPAISSSSRRAWKTANGS